MTPERGVGEDCARRPPSRPGPLRSPPLWPLLLREPQRLHLFPELEAKAWALRDPRGLGRALIPVSGSLPAAQCTPRVPRPSWERRRRKKVRK